ncbi:hypothetical protein GS429_14690 [Natronorubrum sp. JWXQ-INN-674]|uniref:Uncharacterized protein n=1 Tax=Natronorubrum halalkaliphilum TaxID=2691917 RepID=A0A6B0VND0_9EURY|nr:hypothetical protein [Natronorubrum halalkaliphilum]MXV63291.1 hypothetical protein [Natronorubrum halalkaliphilum]
MESHPPTAIEPPANVLFVQETHCESAACDELCHEDGPTAALTVSFADGQPDQPDHPEPAAVSGKVGLLTIGTLLNGGEGSDPDADRDPDFDDPIVVDSVRDPSDISEIGVAISRFCKHWSDDGEQITVCFDSLDALLRGTPPKKVFQFAHVLTDRLESAEAYAHFHFDPTHHDERIISTFGTIFDTVVTDESIDEPLPEATDEEVERLLAEWTDEPAAEIEPTVPTPEPASEATDEEIAQRLEK